ncbi:chemotaxis protein CheA [Sporolituus thermophilus]|uniref:histidine kinase n=1 Tax=Sporolituus thermophilus DSM 23256 TaxID=1123285 RepID=A0A1G7JTV6_9FIRM|nr:chemotaxis protein CheA [Sporolituus thermophilus]SDF28370.1 two-component system, chemotaxis family, sensor kinase CheA [Sporolituus thermophilus DSM 23256]
MYRIAADDIEMLQSFVEESTEYLAAIEAALLELETGADKVGLLNEVFRHVHTIKGLSKFVEIHEVSDFTHKIESLLDALRKGKAALTPAIVTFLLESCDVLGMMLTSLRQAYEQHGGGDLNIGSVSPAQVQELIESVERILTAGVSPEPEPAATAQAGITASELQSLAIAWEKLSGDTVLEEFLPEAEEHLEYIVQTVLPALDGGQEADGAQVAELFRRIHTVKGLLGLVGSAQDADNSLFAAVKELIGIFQELEEIVGRVQAKAIDMSGRVIDLCYAAMDCLQIFIQKAHNREAVDLAALVAPWRQIDRRRADAESDGGTAVETAPLDSQAGKKRQEGASSGSTTIRVSEEKVNKLMSVTGELAASKNFLAGLAKKLALKYNLPNLAREVREQAQWLGRLTDELEDAVMSMRMVEIKSLFQKFPRVIRDIALRSGKQIALRMEGEDTELDKKIIEQIADPLMHIIRNAADHGIESIAEREAAGKPREGIIILRAYNKGKYIVIEVEDDGRGMDPEKIKAKAVEKGIVSAEQAAAMSEKQALQFVFLPGFSTAKSVTEISGRGVGMDVVKSQVTALKGAVFIDSVVGKGSKISLQLPLTLVVSRGLLVEAGGEALIFPLENVLETIKLEKAKTIQCKGYWLCHHRGRILAIMGLDSLIGLAADNVTPNGRDGERIPVVVVTNGQNDLGIIVDKFISEQDVLVKSLPECMAHTIGISGAAILGDGRVALVVNVPDIMAQAGIGVEE